MWTWGLLYLKLWTSWFWAGSIRKTNCRTGSPQTSFPDKTRVKSRDKTSKGRNLLSGIAGGESRASGVAVRASHCDSDTATMSRSWVQVITYLCPTQLQQLTFRESVSPPLSCCWSPWGTRSGTGPWASSVTDSSFVLEGTSTFSDTTSFSLVSSQSWSSGAGAFSSGCCSPSSLISSTSPGRGLPPSANGVGGCEGVGAVRTWVQAS